VAPSTSATTAVSLGSKSLAFATLAFGMQSATFVRDSGVPHRPVSGRAVCRGAA
jgi:hypothetical protein